MKRNWFFIFSLSIAALALAGTAAWFSVFGLTQLFYGAGIGITILAASLEFAKVVTVSYVYRFWKQIEKGLRGFYIFAVVFIMFLTSMGIYGFLISGYQKSANKIELRDAQIKIADNKRTLFINQLDRINKSIESSSDRINTLSSLRKQQEKRLDNLYDQKYISVAKRTENQIIGSDEQIRLLNEDITSKMKQTSSVNDSIAFYDQKIAELKASDVSSEISSYQFISDLTGIPMNKVVNFVALVIIFVFDPLAIALLIAVNRLTMSQEEKEKRPNWWRRFKNRRKEKKEDEINPSINDEKELEDEIEPEPEPEFIPEETLEKENNSGISKLLSNSNRFFVSTQNGVELYTGEGDLIKQFKPTETNVEIVEPVESVVEPVIEPVENAVETVVEPVENAVETVVEPVIETVVEPEPAIEPVMNYPYVEKHVEPVDNEFEPKQIASIRGRVNVAHFLPKN